MADISLTAIEGSNFKQVLLRLTCWFMHNSEDGYSEEGYFDEFVKSFLNTYITLDCTKVTVEFPYYDLEYLSSVYSFYVKSNLPVKRDCYRLHFYINDEYMGYITLRPTPKLHIGRIQGSPRLFVKGKSFIITKPYSSSLLGVENFVDCFQFMKQDPEVAMCAQVATWAVVEYATRANKNVVSRKIAEITDMTWTFSERKIPAKGLTAQNIMEVLTGVGLFPVLLGKTTNGIYKNEVLAYIESGIPVIGFMKEYKHAVCLVGHGEVRSFSNHEELAEFCKLNSETLDRTKCNFAMSSSFITELIVNDDNYAPYLAMNCDISLKRADVGSVKSHGSRISYCLQDMDGFIVPLSDKIYFSYQDVYSTVTAYTMEHSQQFPESMVARIFLTESTSFKTYALRCIPNQELSKIISCLSMPSYIWCAELSSPDNYMNGLVDCLFIFDSTRHSEDPKAWVLLQSKAITEHFNGERLCSDTNRVGYVEPYGQYRCNLKEF